MGKIDQELHVSALNVEELLQPNAGCMNGGDQPLLGGAPEIKMAHKDGDSRERAQGAAQFWQLTRGGKRRGCKGTGSEGKQSSDTDWRKETRLLRSRGSLLGEGKKRKEPVR